MEFQDKSLTCSDCGSSFVFTAGEQKFYQEKGFAHEPRRCKDCRLKKRDGGAGGGGGGGARSMAARSGRGRPAGGDSGDRHFYAATCSACGGPARVSFEPSPDRPVFCRTCYNARQNERSYR